MEITYRLDGVFLYIALDGRIDAASAGDAETKIFAIKEQNPGKQLVLDADKLTYISSAGLRVVLKLRKAEPKLAVINVAPEVYEVFDMTGFTDMVTIEKAYPRMSVEGCEFIAKGANGAVYRYDDETILKTYFARDALDEIKQERENARKAFVLGINTAIPYGIVRVGDGYGTVTELLSATSITKLIRKDAVNLEEPVTHYINMLRNIHATQVAEGELPDMKQTVLDWVAFVAPMLTEAQNRKLRALVEAVPKQNTLLHGDYHTNNVMVQNGEPLLIDLDTLCVGHPVFELASMFNAFIGYTELRPEGTMEFYGYPHEAAVRFWDLALKRYLGTEDEEVCRNIAEKAMVVGYTRMLRRALRRPDDPETPARIYRCKEMLGILLERVDSLVF